MARLQILELPEGSSDDRPPFVLIVDECDEATEASLASTEGSLRVGLAGHIGARGVLVFEETIEIPGNDLTGYSGIPGGDFAAFAATVERALGIDTSAAVPDVAGWLLTACRELEKSEAAREQIRQDLNERTAATERVRNLHRPFEHRGQVICWECSAYDFSGQTTDNAPVAHDQCGTLRALNGNTERSPEEQP